MLAVARQARKRKSVYRVEMEKSVKWEVVLQHLNIFRLTNVA
jgi:hypothetical protein